MLLLTSLFSFSQSATNEVVCIPKTTAVKIAKDLIAKDLCDSTLIIIKEENSILNKKINTQSSIIDLYKNKEKEYESNINNYQLIITNKDKIISNKDKIIKQKNKQIRNTYIGSGILIVIFSFVLLSYSFILIKFL